MIIILDMGSGLTCKNDPRQVRDMISAVDANDNRKHEIILKWQLFRKFGELAPLHPGVFAAAAEFADMLGYATTASVFDRESLAFLSQFHIPFVKIACLEDRLYLGEEGAHEGYWEVPVVASYDSLRYRRILEDKGWHRLACVREYPATVAAYEERHTVESLTEGISDHTDHTDGMMLLRAYRPKLYETHFCLDTQTGPDTGPFALRPAQLARMLEEI